MTLETRLENALSKWNLLESRFYQAWSCGELPVEALKTYVREYGAFISLIPQGWQAHGDAETAREERGHVELWQAFAAALDTRIGEAETAAVRRLVKTAGRLFDDKAPALGALYAFEAQQPATSRSKLVGLRAHYRLPREAETYFEVHAGDEAEPRLLLERMKALSASEQDAAAEACEQMSQALREALDGLYDEQTAAA